MAPNCLLVCFSLISSSTSTPTIVILTWLQGQGHLQKFLGEKTCIIRPDFSRRTAAVRPYRTEAKTRRFSCIAQCFSFPHAYVLFVQDLFEFGEKGREELETSLYYLNTRQFGRTLNSFLPGGVIGHFCYKGENELKKGTTVSAHF